VALFLNGGAVLHQLLGHGLARGLEDVDQSAREVLLGFAEEGDGAAILACAAGTVKCVSLDKCLLGKLFWNVRTYRPIR
jgi:hypothetical protein